METFWDLLRDPAHWQFELLLMLLFDGLVGALVWPRVKRRFRHHREDDDRIELLEEAIAVLYYERRTGKRFAGWEPQAPASDGGG